ncbi:methyl-accepting chemotaxis protein [Vallitalea okinawensis]|uniref:methyl-accepting chemotaxis protein n=1 Tax=Vallitalea okinawensis TaxID=2078660 RepID=UPI000CFDBA1C|nr:heme NO-binding domain-containing protein [Vallitalea okinawensis]
MKGTAVSTWLKTCRRLYNDEVVNQAMQQVGWDSSRLFTPNENVDDDQIAKVIAHVAKSANISINELWRMIGKSNIQSFHNDFPAFFEHENLYSFLKSMYDVHIVMTKKFPGAKPPLVTIKAISNTEAIFTYQSSRKMFDYFMGLLDGACEFYNEKIKIDVMSKESEVLKLKLTFEEGIYYQKRYLINKILSLGFLKSLAAKIAVFVTIITLIPNLLLSTNLVNGLIMTAITGVITWVGSKMLLKPMKSIQEVIGKLQAREYFEDSSIQTKDELEGLYQALNTYKETIMADFVGFKGVTDEMNTFAESLSVISHNMDRTSDDITDVVEQVAEGAVNQAENTESAVYVLNENIQALNTLVDSENSNKAELEVALDKINVSHQSIETASSNILETLNDFKKVQVESTELEVKAKDITNIVSLVSQISEQTNLLALNASIEAARAGEHGRGFVVVAEEVRHLSDQTKKAVEEINNKLNEFSLEIRNLVVSIDERYEVLQKETSTLEGVRDKNYEATMSIREVSASTINTISELEKEAEALASIYETIESLAAIAEENSASSEEVSANVTSYTNEIKKLIQNVDEFKEITESFKADLRKYKI